MHTNDKMFSAFMGLKELDFFASINQPKSRSDKGHACSYKREEDGSEVCVSCGKMRDPEEYEEKSALYDQKALTRAIYDDALQMGFFARQTLSEKVNALIVKNKASVKKYNIIAPHIETAISKVDGMREYVVIKGETPIKMVALIAIDLLKGSCVDKSEVLSLLDLGGSNIIPAQSVLQDVQYSIQSIEKAPQEKSSIVSLLNALPGKLLAHEELLANEIYDTLDRDRKWICNTEQVRLRIAALAFLIKRNNASNSKEDIDAIIKEISHIMPDFTPSALSKNIKKYAREHSLFERFGQAPQ